MATDAEGRTIRFQKQKERFSGSNRREDRQKLENQRREGKALSLDPHKLPSEEDDDEEELEEEDDHHRSRTHQQGTIFHAHSHPYLQQQLHQQTLLYAGAVDRLNPSPPPLPPPTTARKRSYLPSSSSPHEPNPEHARLCARMGGDAPNTQSTSRLGGLRHSAGEIVEVQGGHIIRSIGRKDRHSKVCTAKGPRDRRVRLSAHTAIQFYDVQDRLGYDRPSKAVDWLIKKAKASIDQLAELPAWHPTATAGNSNFERRKQGEEQLAMPPELVARDAASGGGGESAFQQQLQMGGSHNPNSSFLPPSMDSDSIADTIKSFFPTGASTEPHSSNSVPFHNFSQPDLLSRAGTQTQSQDLRLSLQSFQDPIILHQQQQQQPPPSQNADQNLFTGTQLGFDPTSSSTPWSEQQHSAEIGRFQRLIAWNAAGNTPWSSSGGGFVFSPPPPAPPMLQPLFAQNQFISQRGPLQSSNTQSVRAWIDPTSFAADNHHHLHQSIPIHPSSFSTIGYSSGGGFTGFRIPARIQGDDEEHDGISDKPSSASSDSRH